MRVRSLLPVGQDRPQDPATDFEPQWDEQALPRGHGPRLLVPLGTWTADASVLQEPARRSWHFSDDGRFVHQRVAAERTTWKGVGEQDGDLLRLEWSQGDNPGWIDERSVHVEGDRLYHYVYQRRGGETGQLAGDYLTEWRRWNPAGRLVEATAAWLSLEADGAAVMNGYYQGAWTEGELDNKRYVAVTVDVDGAPETWRYYVVDADMLAIHIYDLSEP